MPQATYHFPRGFLWGTATAAHQVEGSNTNNQWWKWEQDGHTNGTSGLACDWWGGRWREDFDRAAEGGQNAHRFSVEWSRIQPTPDTWDEDALERYRTMLRGLRERGMTPMVTLHHFTDPLWLAEYGSWETEAVVPLFEKFVRKTVEALKEYCTLWCTLNEPNGYALNGYISHNVAMFPPGKNNPKLAFKVMAIMIRAHAAAYRAIHEIQHEARVGYALNYRSFVPYRTWSPLDQLSVKTAFNSLNIGFPSALATGLMRSPLGSIKVPEAKGTQDYFGLNYYTKDYVTFDLRKPKTLFAHNFFAKDADLSDNKFMANEPEGMFDGLKWIVRTFPNLPIIITENGIEDADDHMRPRYIAQHIHQVWRAVNFNWPVKGYFHWSLVDNFEWERGWTQRFGLWALDTETQKRTKRPSADLYAEICKENGLSSEMVQKYCPEVFDKLFPV
ncbi:MAG: family 1 glycosylhydrolase [Anaerolineae bacterium]|nr:family 1 glycosylhydrolase [Anaerolineae bacterium]MCI0609333.1 family 1 glycosylhydrolase [Anaerolineae bacterium]